MANHHNYTINANIVDISSDIPQKEDKFLVDANVWLWLTYSNIQFADTPPLPYQLKQYPQYIQEILTVEALLYKCELCFAELSHRIEAIERDIYQSSQGLKIHAKAFRHNYPDLRNDVLQEIEAVWSSVESYAHSIPVTIDQTLTNGAVNELRTKLVDPYDLFFLNSINQECSQVSQILTDDGDYASVPGITVFTANQAIIDLARKTRKLIKR